MRTSEWGAVSNAFISLILKIWLQIPLQIPKHEMKIRSQRELSPLFWQQYSPQCWVKNYTGKKKSSKINFIYFSTISPSDTWSSSAQSRGKLLGVSCAPLHMLQMDVSAVLCLTVWATPKCHSSVMLISRSCCFLYASLEFHNNFFQLNSANKICLLCYWSSLLPTWHGTVFSFVLHN